MRYAVNVTEQTFKQVIVEAASLAEAKITGLSQAADVKPKQTGSARVFAFRIGDGAELGVPQ